MVDSSNIAGVVGVALALLCFNFLSTYWRLRHIPGPFWANFTNLPRIWWVKSGRSQEIHLELHKKYGDIVRFGPNMVSISDPAAIPTIYPMRPGFPKGNFYRALMPYSKTGALPAVFNTRDEQLHKQIKSPIAPLFSFSSALTYEAHVDEVLEVFLQQMNERFVETNDPFNLGNWLQYYAFDVMGTLTFSKRYGFLDSGTDINGMLQTIWNYMLTVAPWTQIPWLDDWWNKNPWIANWRPPFGLGVLKLAGGFIAERHKMGDEKSVHEKESHRDMLSRFMELQADNPSIPPWAVTSWTFSNVFAGSDSTGAVLQRLWFNLLTHPASMQRLTTELTEAGASGPIPAYSVVQHLPYLDACVQEASRLHPPFCLPLERVVPEGGIAVCGKLLPGGTVVGCNPYVVNRHEPTFGEDVEEWRPERWLTHSEEDRRNLEGCMLTYGAGRRVCLGKHIAFLEMKKIVPALLLNYQIEIFDPSKFTFKNSWFFKQTGLNARIKKK